MRDHEEIEREMFEARQDLEQNLAQLDHRVREKAEIKARATHAADQFVDRNARKLAIAAAVAVCALALLVLRRLTARA